MFKFKSANAYWEKFSAYQSFVSVDEMNALVKRFMSVYDLPESAAAVLNTIKLHAKQFVGVCWLYREEIARKAGVSLSSVSRAIRALKEVGILTVHHLIHTKRGGQTHSVYVINNEFAGDPGIANEPANDTPLASEKVDEKPRRTRVRVDRTPTHKNSDTNTYTKTKKDNSIKIENDDTNILQSIPDEFVSIMKPYYDDAKIIAARWKTACVAIKKSCVSLAYTSWETIGEAWASVVKLYKRNKIRNASDDGLGGYFYRVLCDYLMDDYLRNVWTVRT